MKKSLVKKLARMAKDGDPEAIEAVAELLEEVAEGGTLEPVETAAEEVAEAVTEVAEEPAAVVETPEGTTIVVDEATLGEVISRLDQIIALLTPAASDEDPIEEIAEAVEEALEAAAEAEEVLPSGTEEIAEIIGEVLEPGVSGIMPEETEGDECEEEQGVIPVGDALRAALRKASPLLGYMSARDRLRLSMNILSRLTQKPARKAKDAGVMADMSGLQNKPTEDPRELGRRIMAKRSANKRKQ